jgi:hypothetical protein
MPRQSFEYTQVMRALALAVVPLAMTACGGSAGSPPAFSEAQTLTGTTSVGTAPMFAVSPAGKQTIAWVSAPQGGTDGRLYVSVNNAAPTEIRDTLGPIEAHGEAPPKIAYASDGSLYAAYTVGRVVPGARFPQSALRLVKSTDDGKTWAAPVTITDGEEAFGAHSFHALHVASDGTIYASWLGTPPRTSTTVAQAGTPILVSEQKTDTSGHAQHMSPASAPKTGSWIARSTDGGRTFSPRVRVDVDEACPCCRTALASDKNGALYMAWRHVHPGNIRDVVVAKSLDRGATWGELVRVHADDWKFDGCPHAGPSIAVDSAGVIHIAWWTGKDGSAGVYYAKSRDGAKSFDSPVALGVAQASRPAHVQLALAAGNRVVVAWDDGTKQIPQVVVRTSRDGGGSFTEAVTLSAVGRAASFPVIGVMGDSVAVAWSEESEAIAKSAAAAQAVRDPKSPMGLHAVGKAQVLMRRGALR